MLIVTAGFALFLLSSFPPTRWLGVLVCIGAIITDLVVLLVLPAIVTSSIESPKVRRLADLNGEVEISKNALASRRACAQWRHRK